MPTAADRVVVDASAVLMLLADQGDGGREIAEQLRDAQLFAPQLLPFEVWNVLRRWRASGRMTPAEADERREAFAMLPIELWPTGAIAEVAWAHTGKLSAYDASYVALAEALGAKLVTVDQRLLNALGRSGFPVFTAPAEATAITVDSVNEHRDDD